MLLPLSLHETRRDDSDHTHLLHDVDECAKGIDVRGIFSDCVSKLNERVIVARGTKLLVRPSEVIAENVQIHGRKHKMKQVVENVRQRDLPAWSVAREARRSTEVDMTRWYTKTCDTYCPRLKVDFSRDTAPDKHSAASA